MWTPDEIREVLDDEADAFMVAYGVTRGGNTSKGSAHAFEGEVEQRPNLADARRRLFETREQRVYPGRYDKVITSWSGLMLAAFAEADRTLDREDYEKIAERNADFLLRELRQRNGHLLRTWKAGKVKLKGYLEDHSYLVEGLLAFPFERPETKDRPYLLSSASDTY